MLRTGGAVVWCGMHYNRPPEGDRSEGKYNKITRNQKTKKNEFLCFPKIWEFGHLGMVADGVIIFFEYHFGLGKTLKSPTLDIKTEFILLYN